VLDTTFALRAPHSGTGIYLERLQHALAGQDDVTVLAVATRAGALPEEAACAAWATRWRTPIGSSGDRAWAAWTHGHSARRADTVICVSAPPAPRGHPRHFLYVGDGEPRKNVPLLLAAYARYRAGAGAGPLGLVLAGSATGRGPGIVLEHDPNAARVARPARAGGRAGAPRAPRGVRVDAAGGDGRRHGWPGSPR